jgi:phage terminase small subunit
VAGEPKRDLTEAELKQRQLVNVRHGGYVKAPAGLRQRDGRVRRALAHLRKIAPWLKPSDLPAARSYCEIEIMCKDMFADIRANGSMCSSYEGDPKARSVIAEYRNLKRVSLAYARELGLTPVARKQFKLEDPFKDSIWYRILDDEKPSRCGHGRWCGCPDNDPGNDESSITVTPETAEQAAPANGKRGC